MPLGDSITRGGSVSDGGGYRRPLYQALVAAGMNVDFVGSVQSGVGDFDQDHEGHSGWRDVDIAANVTSFLTSNPADIVLLHIGINSLDPSPADVQAILNNIDSVSPETVVVLARITSVGCCADEPPCSSCQRVTQFNDNVAAMAAARIAAGDKIILVDMEHALTYPGDLLDGLHPNASGYSKMTAVWLPAVAEAAAMLKRREMIGISCTGAMTGGGHLTAVADGDIMGLDPQAHWNSTGEGLAAGTLAGLKGASGASHPDVAAAWSFEEVGWSQNAVEGQSIPPASLYEPARKNHKLMGGLLGANSPGSLTLTGLDSVFGPGAALDAIVYVDAWNEGHEGRWKSIVQVGGAVRTIQSVSFSDAVAGFDDATADGVGNFLRFAGVIGDDVTVTVSPFGSGPGENVAFLNGVQIIGCSAGTGRPTISQQPANAAVCEAGDATFAIGVEGAAPLHYQWSADGGAVGGDAPTLTLAAVQLADSGSRITCSVTDDCGAAASGQAVLTVFPSRPVIERQPASVLIHKGGEAVFTVAANGGGPLHYRWYWNGEPLGQDHDTLRLSGVRLIDDEAKITCAVTDDCGTVVSNEAVLTVSCALAVSVTGGGSVASDPPGGMYRKGTSVRLTPLPAEGWLFSSWSGAAGGGSAPLYVQMVDDLDVGVVFTPIPPPRFNLTTEIHGAGSVARAPAGDSFERGTRVRLEAVADSGWQFVEWSGAAGGSDRVTSVTMDADLLVQAHFAEQQPAAQTQPGGNGQSSGSGNLWNWCGVGAAPASLLILLVFAPRKRRRVAAT